MPTTVVAEAGCTLRDQHQAFPSSFQVEQVQNIYNDVSATQRDGLRVAELGTQRTEPLQSPPLHLPPIGESCFPWCRAPFLCEI
ncbi:hypothetical protein HAX54_037767 [Datura stramonium]|uniref:Uncharacterized protein n=1 Tax=Datura stramonium TaxID=4076 RepID=A0ABS8RN16_DATST|nr:hypothetical protein [Datura stramonium]